MTKGFIKQAVVYPTQGEGCQNMKGKKRERERDHMEANPELFS